MGQGGKVYFYGLAGILLAADQASKFLVGQFIPASASIPIIPGLFNLTHILNPGAAFGFLATQDASFRNPFFIGISALALLILFFYYRRHGGSRPLSSVSLGMIGGGAMGNLLDRLRQGAVVDFLDLHVGGHHWPAFNLADSAISIGVGLLIWELWRETRRQAPGTASRGGTGPIAPQTRKGGP